MQLEEAIRARQSSREMTGSTVSDNDLKQVLWAAQGSVDEGARRTCPSAGAAYPLTLRVLTFCVEGLPPALFEYDVAHDRLVDTGSAREDPPTAADVAAAALGEQGWIERASAVIAIVGETDGIASRFEAQPPPGRWQRYLWMECGAAAQNAGLVAADRGLAMTIVAGFDDRAIAELFDAGGVTMPLALLVIGQPRSGP